MNKPYLINSISEQHRLLGLAKPKHPLISVFRHEDAAFDVLNELEHFTLNFYCISIKKDYDGKLKYGHRHYDFDEGMMAFISPNQLLMKLSSGTKPPGGITLMFHPDFIANTALASKIRNFHFFSYELHEALHLSEQEEAKIEGIFASIESEYQSGIDNFSQHVMIAQIEVLLQYSSRFYARQFITRKVANDEILTRLENVLDQYWNLQKGLPTVRQIATDLNLSADYLSDMLRITSGQTAQQHIQAKVIERAKQLLTTTDLQISEIAYQMGFEYPQSFHKLFKNKTKMSPMEYRSSFN